MRIKSTLAGTGVAVTLVVSACSGSSGSSQPTSVSDTRQSPTTLNATTVSASSTPNTVPTPSTTALTPSTTAPTPTTTLAGAVDPNATEIVEPGDIPDNQVFIPFAAADGVYAVKVPEGWARTEAGDVVTFTDNYNSIALQSSTASTAPTVETVSTSGLADVTSDPTFTLIDIKPVTRKAGTMVLATYEIGSTPNPVTGKKALLAVERYVCFHSGTVVTMTLSGAKGADNVDPWRIVSDSLAWT